MQVRAAMMELVAVSDAFASPHLAIPPFPSVPPCAPSDIDIALPLHFAVLQNWQVHAPVWGAVG